MFKYLHEMGANFELPNYAGITPIMVAQSFNSQKFTDVVVGIIGRGQEDKQSDDAASSIPKKVWHYTDMLQSKNDGKDQETIQSSTTPDSGYHMGK